MTEGILEGKRALVAGVANKRSIAWAIAQALHGAGADARVHLPGRAARGVGAEARGRRSAPTSWWSATSPTTRASTARSPASASGLGGLDILVHSIAYAPAESFQSRFIDTSREAFRTALDISAYSMIAMARAAEPLMAPRGGGAMVTMTYMASERAFPGYNVMASAKAALECSVRYLAYELGPTRHPRQRHLGRAGADAGRPRASPGFDGHGADHRAALPAAAEHRGRRRRPRRALPVQPAGARWSPARCSTSTPATTRWACRWRCCAAPSWAAARPGRTRARRPAATWSRSNRARMLIDCGSGIATELRAHDPGPLTDIIISHFHADHWFDLVPLHYAHRFGSWSDRPQATLHLPPGGRAVLDTVASVWDGSVETFEAAFDISEYDPARRPAAGRPAALVLAHLHYTTCYAIKIDGAAGDDRLLGRHRARPSGWPGFAHGADLFVCEAALRGRSDRRRRRARAHGRGRGGPRGDPGRRRPAAADPRARRDRRTSACSRWRRRRVLGPDRRRPARARDDSTVESEASTARSRRDARDAEHALGRLLGGALQALGHRRVDRRRLGQRLHRAARRGRPAPPS